MRRVAVFLAIAPFCAGLWLFGPKVAAHGLLSLGFPSAAAALFDDASWKGAALSTAGRWSEAAEAFGSDHGDAYNQGVALAHAGRLYEAVAAFDRALAMRPEDADAAYNKALLEAALLGEKGGARGGVEGVRANSPATKAGGSRDRPQSEGRTSGAGEGLAAGRETQADAGGGGDNATKVGENAGEAPTDRAASGNGAAADAAGAGHSGDLNALVADLLRARENRMRRRLQMGSINPDRDWLQTLPDDPGLFLKLRIRAEKARRLRAAGGPLAEDD